MFRHSNSRSNRPHRLTVLATVAVLGLTGTAQASIADADKSGHVGLEDLSSFITAWLARDAAADVDLNGDVSLEDLFNFVAEWVKEMSDPTRNQTPQTDKQSPSTDNILVN